MSVTSMGRLVLALLFAWFTMGASVAHAQKDQCAALKSQVACTKKAGCAWAANSCAAKGAKGAKAIKGGKGQGPKANTVKNQKPGAGKKAGPKAGQGKKAPPAPEPKIEDMPMDDMPMDYDEEF